MTVALKSETPNLPALHVTLRALADLKPNARNARKHSASQIKKLTKAIEAFGFTAPIVLGTDDEILAGHARLDAARAASLAEVPTISLAHLSPAEQRGFMIADNRLAELASWDADILKLELTELKGFDFDFDLTDLGFETSDLNRILFTTDGTTDLDEADDPIPAIETVAVTAVGDIWILGRHRLICGDARMGQVYGRLMPGGEVARVVVADAPYNVPVAGHVTKRGADRREFAMGVGEMSVAEFTDFLTTTLGHAGDRAVDGAIAYVFMDWRHMTEVLDAGRKAIGELKNLVVWAKRNAGMGAFYRSQHELVFVFKKGTAPHVNTFGLGEHGRYRTNVWSYPGASGFHADRDGDLAMHVTPKPVAMIAEAILDVSHLDEIVLDPFGGSGSTLIAAEKTDRCARLIELDQLYCDVICRRFIANGGTAVREADGKTFEQAETDATSEVDNAVGTKPAGLGPDQPASDEHGPADRSDD